jgi:hypothetical protein
MANMRPEKMSDEWEYSAGLGTTPGMWEMLSELLEGEKLPESLSRVINLLASKKAEVVEKANIVSLKGEK